MLLTIDFLILNFKGSLRQRKTDLIPTANPFHTIRHEYGNRNFKEVYDLFYDNRRIGTLNTCPNGVIDKELMQLQFVNDLFYTKTLTDLLQLVREFVGYFACEFEAVNRLDIAIDKKENRLKYHELYNDIMSGTKLLKGREKAISSYSLTKKGRGQFNGFTVGKRNSSRFLRIYNKSEALRDTTTPKPYISDWHNNNGLTQTPGLDIWRFEYQLNARFFTDLRKYGKNITYQIFELETLINLIEFAQKNHFEVVYNTGKSETNKEKRAYDLFDWQTLYDTLKEKTRTVISKIKRVFEPSINIQKRLIKSLFRQYYIEPNLAFLYPLIKIVNEYNLRDWFREKYTFYLHEFLNKEKIKDTFNEPFFIERFNLLAL